MKIYQFYILIFLIVLLGSCNEKYYFKKSFKEQKLTLNEGDSIIIKFNGITNWYWQNWKGDLMIVKNSRKINYNQIGTWLQNEKNDTSLIFTITEFDTTGSGLIMSEKIFGVEPGEVYTLICQDTLINSVKLRKCIYRNYDKDSNLIYSSSKITFDNPNKGEKYGEEIIYYNDGRVNQIIIHNPTVTANKIKK